MNKGPIIIYGIAGLILGVYWIALSASNLWMGKKYLDFLSQLTLLSTRLTSGRTIEKKLRASMLSESRMKIRSTYYLLLGLVTLLISFVAFTS